MGRVGLSDAVPALTTLVADTDTDVRQAALFALTNTFLTGVTLAVDGGEVLT